MVFKFSLCPDCCARYAALRFNLDCDCSLNIMPLGTLEWPDEHPEGWYRDCCDECQESIRRLSHVRAELWHRNEIPEEYRQFWEEAQRVLPDWPGFQRLSLNDQQKESLAGCEEGLDELLWAVASEYPAITITDQGGGLASFTARRGEDEGPARRWWEFWK